MWSSHDAAEASNRLQQLPIIVKLFPRHATSHTIPNLALRVGRDNIYTYLSTFVPVALGSPIVPPCS